MSLASVRAFLGERAPDLVVLELGRSTATVALAAEAHDVAPGQIAKTLSLRAGGQPLLLVAAGTARLDNRKARDALTAAGMPGKLRMLDAAEVEAVTGHPVGGVCPFGLPPGLPVFCDVSLRRWDLVLPAAGSTDSAVVVAPERMAGLAGAVWVNACRDGED